MIKKPKQQNFGFKILGKIILVKEPLFDNSKNFFDFFENKFFLNGQRR